MSANRQEDLQNRLASMPAPAPPPGLAEKIKAEIPARLNLGRAKRYPTMFTLRLAASILIVAIGAYAMLRVMSRTGETSVGLNKDVPLAPPSSPARQPIAALQRERPAAQTAPAPIPQVAEVQKRQASPIVRDQEPAAKIARGEPEQVETEAAPPPPAAAVAAPAAAAPAAAGGVIAMKTANVAKESARATDLAVARPEFEATVSPYSGRMIVLVTAPDAVVEGAEKLAPSLYATDKETVTLRLHETERTVRRSDARPWDDASKELKQAVTKAERPE